MDSTPNSLGGKGINLTRLSDAGLPVPQFVVLPTGEYHDFLEAGQLQPLIDVALRSADADHASEMVRTAFSALPMPADQRRRLIRKLGSLMDTRVAIRSSATGEDLDDASFAGQQDSYVNVAGVDDIMARIIDVWSSLWTARAIAYRRTHGIADADVSIAVVVQRMVQPDASGVLFTVNPLSGSRDEVTIDAVPGMVDDAEAASLTPDHLIASASGRVLSRTTARDVPTLSDAQVASLVALGRRVAELDGSPQDIEWVRVGDEFWLVQSRPITTLYPVPDAPVTTPTAWLNVGALQGVKAPIRPLGQDAVRALVAGGARLFGRRVDWRENSYLWPAGERLWLRVDGLLRNDLGRRVVQRLLPLGSPTSTALLTDLGHEPAYASTRKLPDASVVKALASLGLPVVGALPSTLRHPEHRREILAAAVDDFVSDVDARLKRAARLETPEQRVRARVAVLEDAGDTFLPTIVPELLPLIAPALTSLLLPDALKRWGPQSGRTGNPERSLSRHLRAMFGDREDPPSALTRCLDLFRPAFEASASELATAGHVNEPGDVYYLRLDELRDAFGTDWRPVVAARKDAREREARRPRVPRVMASDGRTFFDAPVAVGDLAGMGVSPGVAEGIVRVVSDPREADLKPGEIIVCSGTDPSWTPLFPSASALVTEVGGLMTHGSVVAREYGLPAVVGVLEATTRLHNGQRIRVDGTAGTIELL